MRNTRLEQKYQAAITQILLDQGYATMARLFNMFTLILTDDPNCVGYTQFDEAVICLNSHLNDKGFSVVARHELLHQFLDHHARIIKHVAKKMGLDPEQDVDTLTRKIYGDPKRKDNCAADWDLSRYYTEEDVRLSRDLSRMFDAEVAESYKAIKGLILEDDHRDWFDEKLSYEEMYDRLEEDESNLPEQLPPDQQGDQDHQSQGDSGQSRQQGNPSENQQGEDGQGGQNGSKGSGQQNGQQGKKRQGGQGGQQSSNSSEHSESGDSDGEEATADEQNTGNEGSSRQPNKKVQIGDFDPEWQAREAAARLQKIKEEIEKGKQKDMTEEEQREERLEKVRQLEKEKENPNTLDSVTMDTVKKKRQEVEKRDAAERARKRSTAVRGDINTFKKDIKSFIKNVKDEADERDKSWSRLDRKNQNPSIMKKGTKNVPSGDIPLVNVYFDYSGSCKPYIKRINEVLDALRELEDKEHLIRLNVKFFADTLGNDEEDTDVGWGNAQSANEAILDDIKSKGAENVVILTDRDSDYCYDRKITVAGSVWWLWSQGNKALNFKDAIVSRRGKNYEYKIS